MDNMVMVLAGILLVSVMASWYLLPLPWARILLAAGRRWARLRTASVQVGDHHWHYLDGGKGPVLLAIHGFGADGDNWLQIGRGLTHQFRVIAPDLPGFGRSSKSGDTRFDIDSQVDRLAEFLQAIGARPAILAGNSMGGWIASAYAVRHPESIRALWLLAPLGVQDCKPAIIQSSFTNSEYGPFSAQNTRQFKQRVLNPMFGRRYWFPHPLMVYYAREARRLTTEAPNMFAEVLGSPDSLESITENLDIPVLLQWGNRDLAVDVSGARVLKDRIKQAEVIIQDGTGHLPMIETPWASLRFFKAFIRKYGIA
jgi:pimeloyl-ACP methyl ester carboxylesterase